MSSNKLNGVLGLGLILLAGLPLSLHAQQPQQMQNVSPVAHAVSRPLREIPAERSNPTHPAKPLRRPTPAQGASAPSATASINDPVVQSSATASSPSMSSSLNFDGIAADGVIPPDTNASVGATQVVQIVNVEYAIYDKTTGAQIASPSAIHTIFKALGAPCGTDDGGDPVVLYDKLAGRWVISQSQANSDYSANYMCIAVSQTSDATGAYDLYSYYFGNYIPDYPKLGVWPDAYYFSANIFQASGNFINPGGAEACAFPRSVMLAGQDVSPAICFFKSFTGSPSVESLLPADLDGSTPPPSGEPDFFLNIDYDYPGPTPNLYRFHVDFATPSNSTFTGPFTLQGAAPYSEASSIPQPGTAQTLDSLGDRLMFRLAYRNFGDHESLVVNHSVVVNSSTLQTGIRWYEIRNPNGSPFVYQQGTYSPDNTTFRWLGSIAQDRNGDIAVGYSVSDSVSVYPGIRYAGRLATDSLGTLGAESAVINGSASQTGSFANRWGDYSSMSIDPADDCTFWYTNEYIAVGGSFNWNTRIAAFKFPSCGTSTPPPAPGGFTAAPVNSQVSLGWFPALGASAYNLYRSTTNGGPYSKIVTLTTTSYTDSAVSNGTTYYYVVTATNSFGESGFSNQASAKPPGPPPAPTGLSATSTSNTQISLNWTASSGATSYNVYRSLLFDPSFQPAGPFSKIANTATTNYTDTGLTQSTTYFYVVTALNANGESGPSNEPSVTTLGPPPTVSSVNPTAADQGQSLSVIIGGSNFQTGVVCSFGAGITVNSCAFTSGAWTASISISSTAGVGPRSVTVTNPDGQSATLNNGFTVNPTGTAPPPALTSVFPSYGFLRSNLPAVVLTGSNFQTGATCNFGAGITVNSCTLNSSTQITANVTIGSSATTGSGSVTITNPDGQTANYLSFGVNSQPHPIQSATFSVQSDPSGSVTVTLPKAFRGSEDGDLVIVGVSFWPGDITSVGGFNRGLATSIYHDAPDGPFYTNYYTGVVNNDLGTNTPATLTLNFSGGATHALIAVAEVGYSHSLDDHTVIQSAFNESPTATTPWSDTLTPTAEGEYLFSWASTRVSDPICSTPGSGWTIESQTNDPAGATICLLDRTVDEPGYPYQASVSPSTPQDYAMQTISYYIYLYVQPMVNSVSPTSGAPGQNLPNVVITGSYFNYFGNSAVCSFGPGIMVNSCTVNSASQITANITISPTATNGPRDVTVMNGDGTGLTNAFFVTAGPSGPAPAITSISPNSGTPAQNLANITITGSNFQNGALCDFGAGITVNACLFTSPTQIRANITVNFTATTGPRNVTITNPDAQVGTLANGFSVAPPPPPTITSVTPNSAGQGQNYVFISLTGNNFQNGATCTFGAGITVNNCQTYSQTQLSANISIAPTATIGPRNVTVTNPDGQSATLTNGFSVTPPPPPTVSYLIPAAGGPGTTLSVDIHGNNFQSSVTCGFGAGITVNSCTPEYTGDTTDVTANITISSTATQGARNVTVTNADGQSTTDAGGFYVTGPPPPPTPQLELSSVNPNSGYQGQNLPAVILTGNYFQSGATCSFGAGITVNSCTMNSITQLTANISIGSAATLGSRDVTVTNPDSQTATLTNAFTVSATPPISVIQKATFSQQPSASGTVTLTLPQATGAGHALIVGLNFSPPGTSPFDVTSVTDGSGDTFTRGLATSIYHNTSQGHMYTNFYYAKSTVGGTNSLTLQFSGGSAYLLVAVAEVVGLDSSAPLDQSAYNESLSATATPWSSAPVTTTTANEYLFSWAASEWTNANCSSPTSGWTIENQTNDPSGATVCLVDRIVAATMRSTRHTVAPEGSFV
jgi:fibronectin type 3 domain-containing protein